MSRTRQTARIMAAAIDELPRYGPTFNEQLASCAQREPIEFAQPIDVIVHPATELTRQIARARREMGPEKWERLNREFEA